MAKIGESELIINPDGSIYHLNLKPEHLADNVIFVGDQNRVEKVSKHFDNIEHKLAKREFITHVGTYKGKRITVMSTGIGPDNIDIAMNEIDALANIDFETREIKNEKKSLNIIRIGTSGSLQTQIPVDSFVLAEYGIGFDGLLHYYDSNSVREVEMEDAFVAHSNWHKDMPKPYIVKGSKKLAEKLKGDNVINGFTGTAGGFYGPQGRILRVPVKKDNLNHVIESFEYNGAKITNFEMETSAIYGLGKLLGHNCCSLNCIIANRASLTFSNDPYGSVDKLIKYTLDKISEF
jgi:uridine phosphorylase